MDEEPSEANHSIDLDISDEKLEERREKREEGELTEDDIEDESLRNAVKEAKQEAEEAEGSQQVRVGNLDDDEPEMQMEMEDETETSTSGGVMEGVSDDDVEEAMDVSMNVREDIDPQHFNYEDQDFSVFGGYGDQANVEYNGVVFLFVQPDDDTQEELINQMQQGQQGGTTEMLNALIGHTVERPENIEKITAEWTPFERMGLGLYVMDFLGLDALGNM